MDLIDYSRYYRMLNIPQDVSIQELDERYLELVEYWTVQDRRGAKDAKLELQFIDEAYGALLRKSIRDQEEARDPGEMTFTMQQVMNGQERITRPSIDDDDLWQPPRRQRSPSPLINEVDEGIEKLGHLNFELLQKPQNKQFGTAPGFRIRKIEGDIKDAPDRAVIVHSVNCQGVWGYGIAAELKRMVYLSLLDHITAANVDKCPAAYEIYREHCERAPRPYDLIGTCLLVPPQPADYEQDVKIRLKGTDKTIVSESTLPKPRRWIACLFTSIGYGKPNMKSNNPGKDSAFKILSNTRLALEELRTRLDDFGPSNFNKMTRRETDDEKPGELWSPKFNSGAFGVDWDDTLVVLNEEFDGFERPWILVEKINRVDYESPGHKNEDDLYERGVCTHRRNSAS